MQFLSSLFEDSNDDLPFTWERIIPGKHNIVFQLALKMYGFAQGFVANKVVLDAGCGEGYGSYLLSSAAASVIGVDLSEETIKHAKRKYKRDNLFYRAMDGTNLAFPDNHFDVVVLLETIEHVADTEQCVREIMRVMKTNGFCIISTPNGALFHPHNKFHIREFEEHEFKQLCSKNFKRIEIYGVHRSGALLKIERWYSLNRKIRLFLKLDFLKLRKLLPEKAKNVLWTNFTRLSVGDAISPQKISTENYLINKRDLNKAINFICVCEAKTFKKKL